LCAEAAVELLIRHGQWLGHDGFVGRFVESATGTDGEMAWVEWEEAVGAVAAGSLCCSSSEARMLSVAASIAAGAPVDLHDALTGLDERNVFLVAAAVVHASGHAGLLTW